MKVHLTKPFEIYEIRTAKYYLKCADNHLIQTNHGWKYCKDINRNDKIMTIDGFRDYYETIKYKHKVNMFDVSIDSINHSYYSNDILSHNTSSTAFYIAWYICFNIVKNILIIANKSETMKEIIQKIGIVYKSLPYYMKPGVVEFNKTKLAFDNGCRIIGQTTTVSSGAGYNAHLIYFDEFAKTPAHILKPMYETIYPTVSASEIARIIITSTPNGMNLFYDLYMGALAGTNNYYPITVRWDEVPGRDEEWKKREINNMGSEAAFNQEFGCQFLSGSELFMDNKTLAAMEAIKQTFEFREYDCLDKLNYSNLKWHPAFDANSIIEKKFIMSIDIAEGVGLDYTILNIFEIDWMNLDEIKTVNLYKDEYSFLCLKQIGLFRDNGISINELIELVRIVITEVFHERILTVIEVNKKADLLLYKLLEEYEIEPSLFLHTVHNQVNKIRKPGVMVNWQNKPIHISNLTEYIKNKKLQITEKFSILELSAFGIDHKGHYVSQTGNDDIVMSCVNLGELYENFDWFNFVEDFLTTIPKEVESEIFKKLDEKFQGTKTDDLDKFFNSFFYDTSNATELDVNFSKNKKSEKINNIYNKNSVNKYY